MLILLNRCNLTAIQIQDISMKSLYQSNDFEKFLVDWMAMHPPEISLGVELNQWHLDTFGLTVWILSQKKTKGEYTLPNNPIISPPL